MMLSALSHSVLLLLSLLFLLSIPIYDENDDDDNNDSGDGADAHFCLFTESICCFQFFFLHLSICMRLCAYIYDVCLTHTHIQTF